MKKRVLSMLMALALCLTLLPAPAFAEGADGSAVRSETITVEGGQPAAAGAPTKGNGQSTNTGEDEQSNSETDTRTEIWFVRKPDSIGRSYDGTTDGSMVSFGTPQFTDGTNTFELTEGTDFTAKKAFDSADAGNHTVTVEVTLIGEAAAKYKLKAGEETFTISGTINKAYPNLTVSLSETTCTVGEKLLPLLSVSGAPEDAAVTAVTYYYTQYQTFAGDSEYEGSDVVPAIDENTAISEPGTYYVYAKSSETKNYDEERSETVELTVNKAVVKAASVTKADGTDGGTYESLPAALDAAQDGDTVKLLENHTTNWSDVEASDLSTLAVVTKRLTLELNGWTVDYLEVGEVVPDEEGGILESTDGNLTIVDNIQDGSHGKIKDLQFVNGSLAIQSGQIGDSDEGKLTCNGNSGSVTVCGGTVLGLTVGEGASVTVSGGSTHAGFWFNDGTLTITGGTFGNVNFRNNGGTIAISGGTFSTIRNTGVSSNIPPMSLLAPGYAFYKDNAVHDGSKIDSLQDVTVKEHTHTMVNNKCACGLSCTHTNTEGASTIGEDGKCTICGTQFAAGIGEIYYTDVKSALNAAVDGQTVRLLANGGLPLGIYASKTLTLDLNGHSLSGYSLNVGGSTATGEPRTGNLTVIDSSGGNGAVGVTVRDGGTLVFDPENDSTTLLQLEVWGGTVELYGGKILRKDLRLNNSITLGDLLPQKAGLAYYCGDTQLTLEEAASKTCDLVVKSCAHGGKNGFDENATACPYCGAPAVAETDLNDGKGGRLRRRFANLQAAIDADRDGGATLQLLVDVTGEYTIDGTQDTGLDLNGRCIKGTVTVKAAVGSNTTTFSNTQNTTTASIDAVVAHRGAKLAGSRYPAVIGVLTLADTTQWKDILQQPTRLGFRVTNADGTYTWYAPDDVKGSQLNNVIINSLPITTKTLNLKVDGKNLTGNSPKVERGTTVQLCASCNTKDADVYIYTGEIVGNNDPTYSQRKAEYRKIGTNWYYVVDLDANTIGTYDIYFTASKDGYSVTSSHKKLTVTKAAIPAGAITAPAANALTYNGNGQALVTAGSVGAEYGEMQYRLGTSGGFSAAIPTATDAGTYTVWYRAAGNANHDPSEPKSIKVTIAPKTVDNPTIEVTPGSVYSGEAQKPAVTVKDGDTAISESEYTVTYTKNINAGENAATVTITDNKGGNYTVSGSTTFSISKAAAPSLGAVTHSQRYTVTNGTVSLAGAGMPTGAGTLTYAQGTETKTGSVNVSSWSVDSAGNVTYTLTGGQVNDTVTLPVKIGSTNYMDTTVNITVTLTDRDTPTVAANAITVTYGGSAVSADKITGSATFNGNTVDGTWSWKDGQTLTNVSDSGVKTVVFTPTDAVNYKPVETTAELTIEPIAVTVTGVIAPGKVYDGQNRLDVDAVDCSKAVLKGVLNEDSVSVQIDPARASSCQYSSKNAGEVTAYLILKLTGADAGNYRLDKAELRIPAKITPKDVTITGMTAENKTYDGSTTAKNPSANITGVIGSDDVRLTIGEASFADKNVGTGKTVTFSQFSLTGTDAANYNLTTTEPVTATANITAKKLESFSITEKETKYYDGTNKLNVTKVTVFNTVRGDDVYAVVQEAYFTGTDFSASDTAKQYKVMITLGGKDAANYTLSRTPLALYGSTKINKATPTGEPKYTKITTSGKILKGAALTTNGSTLKPNDGNLEWVDDKGNVLPDSTRVEANKTYKWRFTPTDTNYTTLTGEIELYHKSNGGGGGSSGYSYYTIKATAGAGGSISPSGSVSVREGRDQAFTITPDKGYAVATVKIDGKSIGAVKSYTFENVSRTHTIEVIFMKAGGNPQTGVFVDVADGSYYEDAVDWAVENGITKGTDDTHFSPDGICTRAQAVTFLWLAAGSPEPEPRTMPFTDVPVDSCYYDAVLWAVENGITKGTSATEFSPAQNCSRAQIVTSLWRSEKSPAAGTVNPFTDVKPDAYYADAVLWAVEENITKGTTGTTFSPDADCTRAQVVTFLWRCKK